MKSIKKVGICLIIIASLLLVTSSCIISKSKEKEVHTNSLEINKVVCLTFDDGPSDKTEKILEILDKYKIRATFFVVGPEYKKKNDLLKRIVSNNHVIGIHSYTHEFKEIYKNKNSFLRDFYLATNWVEKTINIHPKIYRFPGGSSNSIAEKKLIKEIIKELDSKGYKHVDWNVDSLDSKYNLDENKIFLQTINNIKANEKNGIYNQTILFHDTNKKEATIKVLPKIIEYCIDNNYTFDTLNENSQLIQHIKSPK